VSVTIRDIAEAAGVSIGTVSRALKNQRGLSDETRRAVRRIARELGYDASRLRSAKAQRLVFLLHRQHSSFATNPFFSYVLHGVEEACRDFGVAPTLLATGPADPVRDQLRLHEPDAVLAAGYFEAEVLSLVAGLELPMAATSRHVTCSRSAASASPTLPARSRTSASASARRVTGVRSTTPACSPTPI
jgi:LacI family transcriptional regulator, repressor for deo operon, udp, cdd, tsx, nupC, and nupG